MPVDLRCKHDREVRTRAADLFAAGRGSKSVARGLRVPEGAVRKWLLTYRAVGRETLLGMGKSHTRYGWETKVAAASAVVDGGRPKPEVTAELGIVSLAPLNNMARDFWTRHRLSKEKPLSSPTSEGKGGERPCRRGESRTRRTRRTSSPNA